jgi:CBS domain-containing protein
MQARDIMTTPVITVGPRTTIGEAINVMLRSNLSGLPVVDEQRHLVGVLSEGDLLRRAELGTEVKRPRWIETFLMPGRTASYYVHTHGRFVEEIMTRDPVCVGESASLAEIVSLIEHKHIKRVPVMCADTRRPASGSCAPSGTGEASENQRSANSRCGRGRNQGADLGSRLFPDCESS